MIMKKNLLHNLKFCFNYYRNRQAQVYLHSKQNKDKRNLYLFFFIHSSIGRGALSKWNKNKIFFHYLQEHLSVLKDEAPRVDPVKLEQLLSAAYALISPELQQVTLPDFPVDSLQAAALILVSQYKVLQYQIFVSYQIFYSKSFVTLIHNDYGMCYISLIVMVTKLNSHYLILEIIYNYFSTKDL